jgi:hypothetical protein
MNLDSAAMGDMLVGRPDFVWGDGGRAPWRELTRALRCALRNMSGDVGGHSHRAPDAAQCLPRRDPGRPPVPPSSAPFPPRARLLRRAAPTRAAGTRCRATWSDQAGLFAVRNGTLQRLVLMHACMHEGARYSKSAAAGRVDRIGSQHVMCPPGCPRDTCIETRQV